jgi:two-component system, OmpR family, sensor histidine kinase MtrB
MSTSQVGTVPPDSTAAAPQPAGSPEQPASLAAERPAPRRVAAPAAAVWRAARHLVGSAVSTFVSAWRHSLQLRIGLTTVFVTGVVVLLIGIFLVNQITAGTLHAKRNAAILQANSGQLTASQLLADVSPTDIAGYNQAVDSVLSELTGSGNVSGFYSVIILSPASAVPAAGTNPTKIPTEMRKLVRQQKTVVQYASIVDTTGTSTVHGLIIGEPVAGQGGTFELYYLFPLTAEQDTIWLVQRTVLLSGIGLVLFVAIVVLLVTRQVVVPVRLAAQTAERLAGGDLAQRIPVRGTDDIARLGQSFNDMAVSLQGQIRRLEELSRLQRRFTSDVSHELRTPLTTIRMAAELLHAERKQFPPQLARSAELLTAELDRFQSLLGDLLEISRYDAGVARLELDVEDLRVLVTNAVDASRVLAERHGSELIVDAPRAPVRVEMDPRRVERILRNLVGNAIEHGNGWPVLITVRADDRAAAVTVRDRGVGLRPGESSLVFNRFWRGDPSRSRLTGGTGLGLSISLEDARLHGGWLQAWGERGRGAQFRLTLPLIAGQELTGSPLQLEPDGFVDGSSDGMS